MSRLDSSRIPGEVPSSVAGDSSGAACISTDDEPNSSGSSGALPKRIYLAAALLSLIGLADSIYLTIKHLTGQSVQCTISTGCEEVLGSVYATLFGYPLAAYGALAYFTVFSLATLALFGYRSTRTLLIIVITIMTLMTLRLLYIQAFVLGKYCEFCLLSAAITLSLAGLTLVIALGLETKKGETLKSAV